MEEYEESYSLLVLPEFTIIPLPDPQLPQKVWVACIVRIIVGMGLGRAWTYSITFEASSLHTQPPSRRPLLHGMGTRE